MTAASMKSIGRYEVLGEIGRGAMGVVYRARDSKIGRDVAIKTIRLRDLADDSERGRLRERLFREAQSAGILSHPNIVTIYDVAEEGDVAWIAMELVEGPALDRLMASEPLDGKLVLSILSQTAAALDFAHKRGIVHRDIKPANIMIHEGNTAKITDFGVARLLSQQMTQVGSMVGTPNYMSPEQIQTMPVDGRSDQFSLAVIAYELLTGEKPFVADSIAALAYKIVREPAVSVHRLNPTLDWPVDTVLQRALAKDPEARYPTCSDFVFALENACRACRRWQPLKAGAAQDIATSWEAAAPVIAPTPTGSQEMARDAVGKRKGKPRLSIAPQTADEPPVTAEALVENERPPLFLRTVRLAALLVIGGGIIAALLVSGIRYLDQRKQGEAARVSTEAEYAPAEAPPPAPPAQAPDAQAGLPGDPGSNRDSQTDVKERAPNEAEDTRMARITPPAAPTGTVPARLVTNPPGAQLVVDGSSDLSCQAPCTLTLSKGRHTLAATMAGYRRTLRILELPRDNQIFLNLDRASGTLMVRSDPPGAAIYVNGQSRGEKTPANLSLPVGTFTIELVHDDQREAQQVQIRDSAITKMDVQFGR